MWSCLDLLEVLLQMHYIRLEVKSRASKIGSLVVSKAMLSPGSTKGSVNPAQGRCCCVSLPTNMTLAA